MPLFAEEVAASVAKWSGVYGVPALTAPLVHGILERESRHGTDPLYVRHKGMVPEPGGHTSYGPMQVYDTTATGTLGIPANLLPELAAKPELGIWYGTKYLASLLKTFKGDVERAVSAYNAGPSRAVRPFPNPAYVSAVLGYMNTHAVAAASVPLLAILGLVGLWAAVRRRRAA